MKLIKKRNEIILTRVIRATWDGRLDYFIPESRAKELLALGKLVWDCTNHAYLSYVDWPNMRIGDRIE